MYNKAQQNNKQKPKTKQSSKNWESKTRRLKQFPATQMGWQSWRTATA